MSSESEEEFLSADEGSDNSDKDTVNENACEVKQYVFNNGANSSTSSQCKDVDKHSLSSVVTCDQSSDSTLLSFSNNFTIRNLSLENKPETVTAIQQYTRESDSLLPPDDASIKPIKISKIGLKKPRERLKEKIDLKKSRASCLSATDSISSASLFKEKNGTDSSSEWHLEESDISNKDECTSWGSWGSWGSSLVNAATTFTKEVGKGVGSVIETVESGLGVPDPSELARESVERQKQLQTDPKGELKECSKDDQIKKKNSALSSSGFGKSSPIGSLVSVVSGALETASTKVLSGSLDTLEMIGKKTMNIIQEGDPGLRKKRMFFTNRRPNLSSILEEARKKASEKEHSTKQSSLHRLNDEPNIHYAWDLTEGPAHLEALCLIAKQCEKKMQEELKSLSSFDSQKVIKSSLSIKKCSEWEGEDEISAEGKLEDQIEIFIAYTDLGIQCDKLFQECQTFEKNVNSILNNEIVSLYTMEKDLYSSLSVFLAALVSVIHKSSELSLISSDVDVLKCAQDFKLMCLAVCSYLENVADKVCFKVTQLSSDTNASNVITNIYLQIAHANGYIQDCMKLLTTVLQYVGCKQLIEAL